MMADEGASPEIGFHRGELAVQRRAGVEAAAQRLAPMVAPAQLGEGVARFLAERSFAALTGRDEGGRLWVSALSGPAGFLRALSPTELEVRSVPPDGDPLHCLPTDQPVGLIVVEFATRRRVRINGTLGVADRHRLIVDVEQAYGNCPKYIQERELTVEPADARDDATRTGTTLTADDVELIRRSDTLFLGTTHAERGSDASHRGGPPGFVRVDGQELWWPDYIGNNMFNSFGNLDIDPHAALLFPDFATGRTLQLTGTATIEWNPAGRPGDDGHTGRAVRFRLDRLVAGHLLAVRETNHHGYERNPPLTD